MSKVAIIGLSQIETIGLECIIRNIPGIEESVPECFLYDSPYGKGENYDKVDCLIVSSEVFIANLGYFIPRKTRTVVVCGKGEEKCWRIDNGDISCGIATIYADTDTETIAERLGAILRLSSGEGEATSNLSGREKDVLKQIASGKTNKEIADKLSISVNTVITHRKNISTKLGIKSVSGLSLYALMNGII